MAALWIRPWGSYLVQVVPKLAGSLKVGAIGDGFGAFWEPIIHMSESLTDIGEDRIREGRETVDIRWHIWIKEVVRQGLFQDLRKQPDS